MERRNFGRRQRFIPTAEYQINTRTIYYISNIIILLLFVGYGPSSSHHTHAFIYSTSRFTTRTSSTQQKFLLLTSMLNDINDNEEAEIDEEEEEEIKDDAASSMMQSVTDEEALLACRAYLQRKNRLGGWTLHKRRKKLASRSLAVPANDKNGSGNGGNVNTNIDSGVGYFWEDPDELIYLRKGRPRILLNDLKKEEDNPDSDSKSKKNLGKLLLDDDDFFDSMVLLEDDNYSENNRMLKNNKLDQRTVNSDDFYNPSLGNVGGGGRDEEEDDDKTYERNSWSNDEEGDQGGLFTSIPMYPPETHKKLSEAKKALFQDEEWKKNWYEKRWGSKAKQRVQAEEVKDWKRKQKLVEKMPSSILQSPEFAALTDEEVEDAIKTYLSANEKRSRAQKERLKQRKEERDKWVKRSDELRKNASTTTDSGKGKKKSSMSVSFPPPSSANQLSFFPDKSQEKMLREAQRKRSERAKKAYQSRLAKEEGEMNQDHSTITPTTPSCQNVTTSSLDSSPKSALVRIRMALDTREYPSLSDVETIMRPARLGGRKSILIDILSICFDLRGKCIPKDKNGNFQAENIDEGNMKFASTSTVGELGSFVLYKLKQC